jgi:hypothetical protein
MTAIVSDQRFEPRKCVGKHSCVCKTSCRSCTVIKWNLRLHASTFICFLWLCSRARAMASSSTRFLNHIQRRATVGRTPLDEWSTRRRDLYLTTHITDKHPCPGGIRTHDRSRGAAVDYALDREAIETGLRLHVCNLNYLTTTLLMELAGWFRDVQIPLRMYTISRREPLQVTSVTTGVKPRSITPWCIWIILFLTLFNTVLALLIIRNVLRNSLKEKWRQQETSLISLVRTNLRHLSR